MTSKLKIILSAAIILAGVSASPAKNDALPTIDLQKVCRASDKAVFALFHDPAMKTYDSCVANEQAARDSLVKDWATLPAIARGRCVRPGDYLPSYVEWLTCLEMERDVRTMRKEGATSGAAGPNAGGQSPDRRTGSETKECPITHFRDDGSIDWIIAC